MEVYKARIDSVFDGCNIDKKEIVLDSEVYSLIKPETPKGYDEEKRSEPQ